MKAKNKKRSWAYSFSKRATRLITKQTMKQPIVSIECFSGARSKEDFLEDISKMTGKIVDKRPSMLEASLMRRNERTIDMSRCLIESIRR